MKRKLIRGLLAAVMAMTLSAAPVMAKTWENVDSWEKLQQAFLEDTDADVVIVLSGDIDADYLTTQRGQVYTINGGSYVITDIIFYGGGRVNINGDLRGDDIAALETNDEVIVTVNGNLSSDHCGVYSADSSSATINGNIESQESGVVSFDYANVVVNGDVTSETIGINAALCGEVTVNGDVQSENADAVHAYEGASVTVNGDVTSQQADGIEADYFAEITVNGDVSGGEAGVEAARQSSVTVNGDVTGAEAGVEALDEAAVVVEGNVTGGNGVTMDSTANVHVTGDVTGSSNSADTGNAGHGAYIVISLEKNTDDTNFEDTPVQNPGSFRADGIVSGGLSEGGADGSAIFWEVEGDYEELTDEDMPEVVIWGAVAAEGTDLYDSNLQELTEEILNAEVNYLVSIQDSENGTITVDKGTAKAGETVVITPEAEDGYKVSKVYVGGSAIQPVNGVYSFVMPEDGKVEVSAEFEKIEAIIIPTNISSNTAPETSDHSPVKGTCVLMMLSAAVAGTVVLSKKKEYRNR